jgi:hypothetical protein
LDENSFFEFLIKILPGIFGTSRKSRHIKPTFLAPLWARENGHARSFEQRILRVNLGSAVMSPGEKESGKRGFSFSRLKFGEFLHQWRIFAPSWCKNEPICMREVFDAVFVVTKCLLFNEM